MTHPVDTRATPAPKATRREWIGLAVIALPCVVYAMDLTVLDLALPAISQDLSPTSVQFLWIADIYGFFVAGALIPMGTLGDRLGRRRVLIIGAALFAVASVLAAFATGAAMLIATRALLGVAGATLAPSTLSLIRNMFLDDEERTRAIGVWASSYSAGAAIGPLVGGVLLEHFWWGSVFLVSVPVMLLLIATAPLLLPEFRHPAAHRLDVISAGLSLVSVLLVIGGIKQIAQAGGGPVPIAIAAIGVATGIAFVRRQRRLEDPLVDLRLFGNTAFSGPLTLYTVATFVAFGMFIFIAQYLQLVLGLSPMQAGVATAPFAIAFIAGTALTPALTRRFPRLVVIGIGLTISGIGFTAFAFTTVTSGLGFVIAALVVYSLGLAPTVTLATDMIVGAAPPEKAGVAAALSETGSELGGALGIAILGSVGTFAYRAGMSRASPLVPGSFDAARDTLGGAAAVARHLPHDAASELVHIAAVAFTDGLRLAAATSAVLVFVAAAVSIGAAARER